MSQGCFYRNIDGLTIRFSGVPGKREKAVKLNDAFAQWAGYANLGDMLASGDCYGYEQLMQQFGDVPSYLPLSSAKDGDQTNI